jgi:parvulin-like peptidyl-prolyl isomerase
MKKLLLFLFLLVFLNAKIIDEVIASVNNEPITALDILKTTKQMNLKPNQALNYLIDRKLLEQEIKKEGINVDDYDIENAMEKIAKQNGMSLFEFKDVLKQKGEYQKFRNALKDKLLKEKLFDKIVKSNLNISIEDLKKYYNQHKDEFKTFKTIQVTKYISNNPMSLNQIKNTLLVNTLPNVQKETEVYEANELPQNLLYLFAQTKVGEYTPIINEGMYYTMYHIDRKDGINYLPFDKVKDFIAKKLMEEKKEQILKDYFQKIKNQADIKIFN